MPIKLSSGVMPPSNVGRKPKPINEELSNALFDALSEALPERVETENYEEKLYPAFFGPDFSEKAHVFQKDFQAQADGRKYAKPLHKRIGKVVRVNVYHNGVVDSAGKVTDATRYTWRLYIPVSEFSDEELAEAEEADSELTEDPEEDPGMVGGSEEEPKDEEDPLS